MILWQEHKLISTLLIGLGNIGQLYDYKYSSSQFNLTHAQALSSDKRFDLVAGIDVCESLKKSFEHKFDKPAFTNITELKNLKNPELVIIATPAETHADIIFNVLERMKPQAILCEKPLAFELEQAENIVRWCAEAGVQLYVNFIRRTDPAILELKTKINSSKLSDPFAGVCWYSRGLYNTGSHFADLFQFLFGRPTAWAYRKKLKQNLLVDDVQIDFNISFLNGNIEFKSVPSCNLFYNKFELILHDAVISYRQNGDICVSKIEETSISNDRSTVSNELILLASDMDNYQSRIYDAVFDAMHGQTHCLATGEDALSIAHIFENLKTEDNQNWRN